MRKKCEAEMLDERGSAGFLDPILDNPAADKKLARMAVERAIAEGTSPALAERLYGYPTSEVPGN